MMCMCACSCGYVLICSIHVHTYVCVHLHAILVVQEDTSHTVASLNAWTVNRDLYASKSMGSTWMYSRLYVYRMRSNYSRTKLSRLYCSPEPSANFGWRCYVTVKMDVGRTRTQCPIVPLQRLWVQIQPTHRCLSFNHSVILVWSV